MSLTINEALANFKALVENAIKVGGRKQLTSVIRSATPILNIHEAVKGELIKNGILSEQIFPPIRMRTPELKLAGSLKQKNQDICVTPMGVLQKEEILTEGLLKGVKDPYGEYFTERTISINVRSQMSSLENNFDTMFERTFSEAQNLHDRCPKMCLGEVYMIAIPQYDNSHFDKNSIVFKSVSQRIVEQYISSFLSVNNRIKLEKSFFQYEKVCLLIVDFSHDPPKLYESSEDLKMIGLLPKDSTLDISTLAWDSFASDLISIWKQRFEENKEGTE